MSHSALRYRQSGRQSVRSFHGSSLVRSHLYAWAMCMIAPSSYRVKSDIGRNLSDLRSIAAGIATKTYARQSKEKML
ncbi:MAG: hypothetical protein AAF383_16850 [Cyanobacteria bacterium P01_A01_bin.83]